MNLSDRISAMMPTFICIGLAFTILIVMLILCALRVPGFYPKWKRSDIRRQQPSAMRPVAPSLPPRVSSTVPMMRKKVTVTKELPVTPKKLTGPQGVVRYTDVVRHAES